MFRTIFARNIVRPIWWTGNDTISEFGGRQNFDKAVQHADSNVKAAAAALRKADRTNDAAMQRAYDAYEQAKFERAELDNVYDDTIAY